MVTVQLQCVHCGSERIKRDGKTRNGKQRYRCHACARTSRENAQSERYSAPQKEQILRAYLERPSMRGITRIFGVSRPTLIKWLKKKTANCGTEALP